jgi:hypothetical protein
VDDAGVETFVLRVFVPADRELVPFAGTIEHVGAGRSSSFQGVGELVQAVLGELHLEATALSELKAAAARLDASDTSRGDR